MTPSLPTPTVVNLYRTNRRKGYSPASALAAAKQEIKADLLAKIQAMSQAVIAMATPLLHRIAEPSAFACGQTLVHPDDGMVQYLPAVLRDTPCPECWGPPPYPPSNN